MSQQLYTKIVNETYNVEMHSADVYKEILDKSSEKVKILVKNRNKLKRAKGHFFVLFATIAICFLAIKFLVFRNAEIETFINSVL